MKKLMILVVLLWMCDTSLADTTSKSDYAVAFEDGGIYGLVTGFELVIHSSYDLLVKVDALECAGTEDIEQQLIRNIDGTLNTLGAIIADIESGKAVSPGLAAHLRAEEERMLKAMEASFGKEKVESLRGARASGPHEFWLVLKQQREEKGWKLPISNPEVQKPFEAQIQLALDTLITYDNIFKID